MPHTHPFPAPSEPPPRAPQQSLSLSLSLDTLTSGTDTCSSYPSALRLLLPLAAGNLGLPGASWVGGAAEGACGSGL